LEAVIEVLDAKSDKAVMRLGIFVTELFIGEFSFRSVPLMFWKIEIPMMESL